MARSHGSRPGSHGNVASWKLEYFDCRVSFRGGVMSEVTREQVIEYLSNMPVTELSSLIGELETKWGVSARPAQLDAPVPLPGVPTTTTNEQTEFDVIITGVPADKKIAAIKVMRDATDLGLKEAKEMIDNVASKPAVVKQSISKADAEELAQKCKDAGCEVSVR